MSVAMQDDAAAVADRLGIPADLVAAAAAGNLASKLLLLRRAGLHEAFSAYRCLLRLPDSLVLEPRWLAGLRAIAAHRQPGVFHEIAPAGEPFTIPPPRVIGDGNQHVLTGNSRSVFVACLNDARVRGRSALIDVDDVSLLDYQGNELTRLDDRLDFDPAIFAWHGDEVWTIVPRDADDVVVIDEAFMLLGCHTNAFGHWMWEYLPQFIVASMSGRLPPMPVLIDSALHGGLEPTHRQALLAMLPPDTELIELPLYSTMRVRRLWCAPSLMHMPIFEAMNDRFRWDYLASPPARFVPVIQEMARRAEAFFGSAPGEHQRVFLARPDGGHRRLVNRAVIEAVAEARGFFVIRTETLDFAAQVRLLRGARFVVGPEGSAFFLAFFSRPSARIWLLDHAHTAGLPLLTGLFEAIGLDAMVSTGRYVRVDPDWPHFSDYEIDETAFARLLDTWLRGG
jgi:capsular polysaccharide biosynthesis protein